MESRQSIWQLDQHQAGPPSNSILIPPACFKAVMDLGPRTAERWEMGGRTGPTTTGSKRPGIHTPWVPTRHVSWTVDDMGRDFALGVTTRAGSSDYCCRQTGQRRPVRCQVKGALTGTAWSFEFWTEAVYSISPVLKAEVGKSLCFPGLWFGWC